MNNRTASALVSVVVPVLNEAATIPELVRRLRAALDPSAFEILFVNDGSTDGTRELLQNLHAADSRIKAVHLTRRFGHQPAIAAGLGAASGDAVIVMDGDLQDRPEDVLQLLEHWRGGFDVAYAIRGSRDSAGPKGVLYKVFYRLLNTMSEVDIPVDSGDFCVMDRRVVDLLVTMPERSRFIRGLRSWVGFRQVGVVVHRDARYAGRPQFTIRRLVRLALDGFFGFSYRPLQLASVFGFCVSAAAIILAVGLVLLKITRGIPLIGWTSLIVSVLFLGGVQLISLGILGEYVARIYDETRRRPSFLIESVDGDTRISALQHVLTGRIDERRS